MRIIKCFFLQNRAALEELWFFIYQQLCKLLGGSACVRCPGNPSVRFLHFLK